ncbi:lycopene cyclase domain-containing protein [Salinibacterium sp. dk2585]|uniref:lycopene cyclase domain-containing protein n=1 Tax=unclassified Salinibacterium TaxID=2632331 RepID=UPI0011C24A4F|nr:MULTISPECIES: lycopene cyclase domain-containing protein [unclassified Salinibacterium]QEE60272.1 lycopene cyclase domain-containing protein [Salinibacterium sp. dk2585]TXK55344.1 lycopene cyclase domain-containing protein [Salinibacterium sp. dk5596]
MHFAYLAALLVSLFCMTLLDRRFTLFFWRDWRRATAVMAIGIVFFVIWDFAGISLDIFYRGNSPWMTGIEIAPEMPIEELFFLALLCYVTMVAYGGAAALLRGLSKPARDVSKPSAASNSGAAR